MSFCYISALSDDTAPGSTFLVHNSHTFHILATDQDLSSCDSDPAGSTTTTTTATTSRILASCNSLRSILDLSVSFDSGKNNAEESDGVEVFVLEGPRTLVRIAKKKDKYQCETKEELSKTFLTVFYNVLF